MWQTYTASVLHDIASGLFGGYDRPKYAELLGMLIEPKKQDTRSADDIVQHLIDVLGGDDG